MTIGVDRQWNSWSPADPLAVVHLPTGLALRFSLFSSAAGCYRIAGQGPGVTLYEHAADGGFGRARVAYAGSEIEISWCKPDPHQVALTLKFLSTGEWGLRLWAALEVGFLPLEGGPAPWRSDEPWVKVIHAEPMPPDQAPRLLARHRSLFCSVRSMVPAVYGGAYQKIEDFAEDLAARGYYAPPRIAAEATWGVLRFNAQMHPEIKIAASLGTDEVRAEMASAALLQNWPEPVAETAPVALAAVRDVLAWNTVWDKGNHRATTVLTRNWLSGKFSGWGVWQNDILFNAIMAGLTGDFAKARENLAVALEYQTPEGNLACLRTTNEEWIDRSTPPMAAYTLWRLYEMSGDRGLLAEYAPVLLRAHQWWLRARDGNGDGLVEYGSTPTGTGAFVHTLQAAMDEAFMDNAPIFDRAVFDPKINTLTMTEPGLNALLSLDAQCLAKVFTELGDATTAADLQNRARDLNERISTLLWDEARGCFAARHWSGVFESSLAASCFYPLLCGAATPSQVTRMIEGCLLNPDLFWGERVVPSSAHNDPASADNVYWRGRIWPPHLFFVWEGLRRVGRMDVATTLVERAWKMFAQGWEQERLCRENFHRAEATGDEQVDSDRFYSWGALIPAMKFVEDQQNIFKPLDELHAPNN